MTPRAATAIIGTAGHIDHGKTALIKALTGQDTDRLKDEKERGISIDLGFAYLDVPGVGRVGVVDVPGHERFIRNMLAGVHGIDIVLLTISADDGVMPQTEEHLDILHLLDVRRGIVVITKSDLADASRLAEVREEIEILTVDTVLEGASVVPVSSLTGAGLEELRAEIGRQLQDHPRRRRSGYFRLPVDRAFLIKGHGLIATGTAVAGEIGLGATVRILPGGETARVRSIEVHGASCETASAGQRVALNLAGIERADVGRDHVVCDERLRADTRCFDAAVELRPGPRRAVRHHGRARLHVGTAETLATVVMLDGRDRLEPGDRAYCQLRLGEPVMALRGDRFILRTETAEATIGGGVVLHPFASRHRRRETGVLERLRVLDEGGPAEALRAFLELYCRPGRFACPLHELVQGLGLREEEVLEQAASAAGVLAVPEAGSPEAFVLASGWEALVETAREIVGTFHRDHPLEPGMELESLRTRLPAAPDAKVFRWATDRLVAQGTLVRRGSIVRLPEHRVALDARATRAGAAVEAALRAGGLTPPDLRTLDVEGLSAKELQDVLAVLEREGRVVRVAPDLYYSRDAVDRGIGLIREHCARHGEITAAAFRDLIDASRKYSIAFLDYCDRTGVTLRVGDVRRAR
jgi:selenocysteine-specific elongation factor